MLLHYDLDTDTLLDADQSVLQGFALRYNAAAEVRLRFRKAGARHDPAGLESILLLVKPSAKFDEPTALVYASLWTKTGAGETAEWSSNPDTTGAAIATALGIGGGTTNDKATVATQVDFTLTISGQRRISNLVTGVIANSNYRDDVIPPTPTPIPGFFALTALTGGATGSLDAIPTAASAAPNGAIREVVTGTVEDGDVAVSRWVLMAGTTAEDGVTYVRPDDYHADTNARVWVRIG